MPVPNFPTRLELLNLISTNLAGSPTTINAIAHRDVETAIVNAIYGGQVGDIKEIACNTNYISTNFDVSGKGKQTGERYGWAICNGQNNTVDKRGRVAVGYDPSDPSYNVLYADVPNTGATGGEKNVTLIESQMPSHRHKFSDDTNAPTNILRSGNDIIPFTTSPANAGISANGSGTGQIYQTSRTGGTNNITQAHNNMQPYVVTLFIQRIPTV